MGGGRELASVKDVTLAGQSVVRDRARIHRSTKNRPSLPACAVPHQACRFRHPKGAGTVFGWDGWLPVFIRLIVARGRVRSAR